MTKANPTMAQEPAYQVAEEEALRMRDAFRSIPEDKRMAAIAFINGMETQKAIMTGKNE